VKIAFLDLNHVTRGIHTNTVPLGSCLIATYLQENVDSDLQIKIFKSADKAIQFFKEWKPDVIGLAQYSWNSELNLFLAKMVKQEKSSCVIVAGGPNLHLTKDSREKFLTENKDIDICIGYDGEIPFTGIINRLIEGESVDDIKSEPVAGTYALSPVTEKLVESMEELPRLNTLDVFGTPYADGVFDEFLDDNYHPFVQTHRGCPFQCIYCHTGDLYYQKAIFQSPELFSKEMEVLGSRFENKQHVTLYIANANMSLFNEDFAIAEIIRETQDKYNWPRNINVNSGKDTKKLMRMMEILNIRPAIALQTLTEDVLKKVKRINIPFDKYVSFQKEAMVKTEEDSVTELILCLPGETKETFLNTLVRVLNSGVQGIVIYTLMNLRGTAISKEEFKKQYGNIIRHRVVPRQFSKFDNSFVFDTEEVVVGTKDMSFEDYLYLRGLSFVITVFFSAAEFRPLKKFMIECNISIDKWIIFIHDNISKFPEVSRQYSAFMKDTEGELFVLRSDLIGFYEKPENYEALVSGRLGDNLLSKYKQILLYESYDSCLDLAVAAAEKIIDNHSKGKMINNLARYQSFRNIRSYICDNDVCVDQEVELEYDIPGWLADKDSKCRLEDFENAVSYRVTHTETSRQRFKSIIDMNKDLTLSLQVLYRDGSIRDYWPVWSKQN
jgi:radical SAM superfamily enzyme YgiQ (UPF0313 family)